MPLFRFPRFPFPNNYSYLHSNYYKGIYNKPNLPTNNENKSNVIIDSNKQKNSSKNDDAYFFELFGLKLYFDDVLLICLIFFLYQEGVKDDELFISLILLLLS